MIFAWVRQKLLLRVCYMMTLDCEGLENTDNLPGMREYIFYCIYVCSSAYKESTKVVIKHSLTLNIGYTSF